MSSRLRLGDLDPRVLHVLPLGTGNAFTSTSFHTSFLLIAGGVAVAVDCPAPYRRILADARRPLGLEIDAGDIDHIVLTHLHGDHCNGLEEFAYFRRYVLGRKTPADLYLLPENVEPLWNGRLSAVMGAGSEVGRGARVRRSLEDYFRPHAWEEGEACRLAGDGVPALEFSIRRTRHPVPCFGFRVRFGGATLGYSADTPWEAEHLAFLESADLILHEAGEDELHTRVEHLMAADAAVRGKLLLVHVPDSFRERAPGLPIAREGALYAVGRGREPVVP